MRATGLLVAVGFAALTTGCNPRAAKVAADQFVAAIAEDFREQTRQEIVGQLGPPVLASLIGAGASPGGPLCLLGTDAGWQQVFDATTVDADGSQPPLDGPKAGLRMFFKGP